MNPYEQNSEFAAPPATRLRPTTPTRLRKIQTVRSAGLSAGTYLLFFASPFLSLIAALTDFRNPQAKNIVWLFCAYYGLAFYYNSDLGVDSVYYANELKRMRLLDANLETLVSLFYQKGERNFDIFQPLLTFFVSRFTNDYRVMLGLLGLFLGYFYSRFIWFFIERLRPPLFRIELYYILVLAFTMDIGTAINGFRMWTAMFVFLASAVEFWETRKTSSLLLASSSVLIHFSFVVPVLMLLAFIFASYYSILIYGFFVSSFLFTVVDLSLVKDVLSNLPGVEERTAGYIREVDPESRQLTWAFDAKRKMVHVWFLVVMSYCYFSYILPKPRPHRLIGLFSLAMYGMVNLMTVVGSMLRFYYLAELLAVGYVLLETNLHRVGNRDFKLLGVLASPLLALQLGLGVRFFLGFASLSLVLGNPFIVWFFDGSQSLYELLPWRR
jgi:hypothetical protein